MRVLVVEDDPRIARRLTSVLQEAGYAVDCVDNGEDAWFRGDTEEYNSIILDLGLPRMDGLTVLKKWRKAGRDFPVLILTAHGAWAERVAEIDAGADDYLGQTLRHGGAARPVAGTSAPCRGTCLSVARHRRCRIGYASDANSMHGDPIALSPLEYRCLSYLMHHAGRVIPPTELMEHLYAHDHDREPNAVEVLIGPCEEARHRSDRDAPRLRLRHPQPSLAVKHGSLRLRLLAAGAASILIALALAGLGLTLLFERHVERRIIVELELDLRQLIGHLGRGENGALLLLERPLADPRFDVPLSGLYWQITEEPGPVVLRSRSLWDGTLDLPTDRLQTGEVHRHITAGPGGATLLVLERDVALPQSSAAARSGPPSPSTVVKFMLRVAPSPAN